MGLLAWHGGSNPGVIALTTNLISHVFTHQFNGVSWILRDQRPYQTLPGSLAYSPLHGLTYTVNHYGVESWNGSSWSSVTGLGFGGFGHLPMATWDPNYFRLLLASDTVTSIFSLSSSSHGSWTSFSNQVAGGAYVPSQAIESGIVYDIARSRAVVFGGRVPGGYTNYFNDIHELPLSNWSGPWVKRNIPLATSPGGRSHANLCYDPSLGRTVLFGGYTSLATTLGDTWSFDGQSWTNHGASLGLSTPRVQATLAHLGGLGTVMFGGGTTPSGPYRNDTLIWDGATWTPFPSFAQPPARMGHAMCSAGSGSTAIYMFGGWNGNWRNDTWRLNGSGWTQMSPGTSPSARQATRMAFDERRNKLVLFGGNGPGGFLGDTWEYSFGFPATWTQVVPPQSPSPRWNHTIGYDKGRGVVVLSGGYTASGFANDVWEYNGVTWRERPMNHIAKPMACEGAGLAWHDSIQRFVMHGGWNSGFGQGFQGQTWFYNAPNDVPGPSGAPNAVQLHTRNAAVAGRPVTIEFDNPSTFGWLWIDSVADPVGLTLPTINVFCGGPRTLYGPNGLLGDAMGNPGAVTFTIPSALLGRAFTCQGVSLTTSLCLEFTDPMLVTPAGL
ncbi:MAG: hypothetical protein JNK15_09890 [Planctomycetes bacterium]|nr:hypothetical protein [Planctomycetota bacterium]